MATTRKRTTTAQAKSNKPTAANKLTAKSKPAEQNKPAAKNSATAATKQRYDQVAYVMQGGGALGAYHIGVVQALQEQGFQPDWLIGNSIGAINAAIIAGNPPEQRLAKLEEFWDMIAMPRFPENPETDPNYHQLYNKFAARRAELFGQPNFFTPRMVNPWTISHGTPDELSFYSTAPLRSTLERLVDFDRINNDKQVRLSVSAVQVRTGRMVYFDNYQQRLGPEHIMASGALPPGFPAIEIDGEYYWDGGVYTNTPLHFMLDTLPAANTLCFMIDLFNSRRRLPQTVEEVLERKDDITYSSHSRRSILKYTIQQNLRRAIAILGKHLTGDAIKNPEIQKLLKLGSQHNLDIVHIVYSSWHTYLSSKDHTFSKAAVTHHHQSGYEDAMAVLQERAWEDYCPDQIGARFFEAPNNPKQCETVADIHNPTS